MSKGKLADYAIYTGVASGLCALTLRAALSAPNDIPDPAWKFLSFGAITALLFGYLVAEHRRSWRASSFWTLLAILLILHCGLYTFIFK